MNRSNIHSLITCLLLLSGILVSLRSFSQQITSVHSYEEVVTTAASANPYPGNCVSPEEETNTWNEVAKNIQMLKAEGRYPQFDNTSRALILFKWPLRQKAGIDDPCYY